MKKKKVRENILHLFAFYGSKARNKKYKNKKKKTRNKKSSSFEAQ
jgi:hypothetical protein